jgi:thiosulfate dehydrogenase
MAKRLTIVVACLIAILYVGAILAGLRVKNFSLLSFPFVDVSPRNKTQWQRPHAIPEGALGESIRRGALLFDETPVYASQYTTAKVSCASCHAEGGIQPYASPMVGLPALFPMFNARAGHMISLKDRVQECFVRSENGKPLAYDGVEMDSIVNYIGWLSGPEPDKRPFVGHGLIELPDLVPDPTRGAAIYAAQCSGCHGHDGRGRVPDFPPVWGPESFNDGAGMNGIHKMAAFVQHNMPQNRMGSLSPQDAFDVSAFIHAQPRPGFNQAYKNF